jgi:hypothetical protein
MIPPRGGYPRRRESFPLNSFSGIQIQDFLELQIRGSHMSAAIQIQLIR